MNARQGMNAPYAAGEQAAAPTGTGAPLSKLGRWLGVNGVLGLVVAALLGLGFAWWLYGYPLLRGTSPFWWRDNADISQYVAGFNAYVHEAWHWPLLRMESLNTPDGTLVTFLDALPLYSLILKLVHPGKGYWNPFGLYIALCFTMQGVGAWWICREAKIQRWSALVALALLLASFPALTFRIAHTSLMSQWLLVFALAVYLRSGRLGRLAALPWTVLLILTFYLNIYLFAMSSAIFAADILRESLRAPFRRSWVLRAAVVPLVAYGLLFASMWLTMLPMPPGSGTGEWGFGFYSMNVLAPIHGGNLLQFVHPQAHDGQGEGYNYLGIFFLTLTACMVKLRGRHDPVFWCRHGALLIALIALTLYALSNDVYLGNIRLFTVDLPAPMATVTSTFRASGRFFWPVGYAIVVFTVLGVARYVKGWRGDVLLAAILLLQFWDLQGHYDRVRQSVAPADAPKVDAARWDAFLGSDVRALHYYPPFHCASTPAADALLPVMVYAVKHGYPMSTGYIARVVKPCTGFKSEIEGLPASTAVAFEKKVFPQLQDAQALMGPNAVCADMDIVFLCRRNSIHLTTDRK